MAGRPQRRARMMRNPQGQTDTPAFKRWFGNSKVVDKNGKPLVVYHGTRAQFTAFDKGYIRDQLGFHFGTKGQAKRAPSGKGKGSHVDAYWLSIQNPLRVRDEGSWTTEAAIDAINRAAGLRIRYGARDAEIVRALQAAGYDGIVYSNRFEYGGDKDFGNDSWIAFEPTQIKSATANVGTFDPSDPDIRHNPRRNPRLVANPYKEKILLPSGNVQYVYSEQDVAKRHAEKAQRIEQLKTKEQRLRSAVKRDTEAGAPVATAVALIMATYERVGNNESAAEGHFGVTGWQARHFTREGSKYRIDYVGKSGVEQSKVIDQPWLVEALAKHLRKKRKSERVLPVSASTVNRYLADYDVSAKDLRGYGANTEMQKELTRLRKRGPALATLKPKDVIKTLKAEFNAALTAVAAKLGHTTSVLRKQYLVPALEPMYIESGAVLRTFH